MKRFFVSGLCCLAGAVLMAQTNHATITTAEVSRVENVLASDDMRGRRAFSPDIDKAADFIANEFKETGLQTWNNSGSYLQEFWMVQPKFISASGTIDGEAVDPKDIVVITCQPELKIDEHAGYETVTIGQGANLVTGDYSRGAAGFLVENGEIVAPVQEITIASNLNDMFATLDPGSDLEFRRGIDSPTILIPEMTVGTA